MVNYMIPLNINGKRAESLMTLLAVYNNSIFRSQMESDYEEKRKEEYKKLLDRITKHFEVDYDV